MKKWLEIESNKPNFLLENKKIFAHHHHAAQIKRRSNFTPTHLFVTNMIQSVTITRHFLVMTKVVDPTRYLSQKPTNQAQNAIPIKQERGLLAGSTRLHANGTLKFQATAASYPQIFDTKKSKIRHEFATTRRLKITQKPLHQFRQKTENM